jgi:hypothetical protein
MSNSAAAALKRLVRFRAEESCELASGASEHQNGDLFDR